MRAGSSPRVELAVGVDGRDQGRAALARQAVGEAEGLPLPQVDRQAAYQGAGVPSLAGGAVGRSVINHDGLGRQSAHSVRDEAHDPGHRLRFVERRHDHRNGRRPAPDPYSAEKAWPSGFVRHT